MNIYIMVDIEGISGIYAREQVIPSERRFAEGRRYMTDDINVCLCKGLQRRRRRQSVRPRLPRRQLHRPVE